MHINRRSSHEKVLQHHRAGTRRAGPCLQGRAHAHPIQRERPQELREYCVLHRGNKLEDTVEPGDIFRLGKTDYKIVYVGSQVQKNLRDLGHITLRFNANEEGENLEGSLYLENKEVGDIEPGEEIAIYKP